MTEPEVWVYPSEYGAAALAWMNDAVDVLSRELHPILASVGRERIADLPRPEEHASETAELASPLFRVIEASHVMTTDVQDTLSGDVGSFLAMVFELSDTFGSQLAQGMMDHISEVCDASGQTIDAKDKDFIDAMIDALETIDIPFDGNGEHNLSIALHPDTAESLRNKQMTPEQEARIQQVLDRRREEWHASRRRLDLP
ncbi:hypothetical protein DFP74_0535 [Nocardiopsis sp. Huas11]|uniref:hypothetical protein n=1 Tax=Nocardiopsis sp. Huas11 TaxID=2183912 RepID=UPI000F2620F1|nr:hypothetical protein [Nocardiopsis sp. Huas11]RKS04955.1 hypothetical protein DFP74_0535 [Nocardiopsis sp. Huas11]